MAELHEEKKARAAADTEVRELSKQLQETKLQLKHAEARLFESEERIMALSPWKTRALEAQQQLDQEKRASGKAVEDAMRGKLDAEDDATRWQKLLKMCTVSNFLRESRLRKALAKTHEHVSDMLLQAMEEAQLASGVPPPGAPGAQEGVTSGQCSHRRLTLAFSFV